MAILIPLRSRQTLAHTMSSGSFEIPFEPIRRHLDSRSAHLLAKRLLDILVAFLALLLTSPFLVLVAILIKVDSHGPIFFRHQRVGHHGKVFHMLKFRSMIIDRATTSSATQPMAPGDVIKLPSDPRVTPIGRVIRRYSIDELPQLINVLSGKMSLVGPRPLPLTMVDPYPEFVLTRSWVRPGMTGLFQLRDRDKGQNARFMIESDLEYLSTFSIWLDLRILARTPFAVISAKGAY
jgi:lipopolysaccharide/colanic/teichoic acid biosynthesis glycosyltransferase